MSLPAPVAGTTAEGFVLAGGQSSRMGREKAILQIAGVPLVQHALGILRAARLEARISGARCDLSAFAEVVPDVPTANGLGPLSGICAALEMSSAQYVIFVPVDLPLIPGNLITYLLNHSAVTRSAITIVSVAGFLQTFPVVVDRAVSPMLQTSLRSADLKCISAFRSAANALARNVSVLPVELLAAAGQASHPFGLPAYCWFQNINSPHDLAYAETLVRRGSTGSSMR